MRQLSDKEEVQLNACLEDSGCEDLEHLLGFIHDAQADTSKVDYNDPNLLKQEFPKPEGKLGVVFVHVVNVFESHARETGNYPKYPYQLGITSVAMKVGAIMGISTETTKKKINQLAAMGWLTMKFKSIQNPIQTYEMAYQENTPHPSFKRPSSRHMVEMR